MAKYPSGTKTSRGEVYAKGWEQVGGGERRKEAEGEGVGKLP